VTSSSLCTFDTSDQCDGRTFNALFTPDVQSWPAYKQNATNPGQFFYNLIVDDTDSSPCLAPFEGLNCKTIDITVPWPFITVGAMPVHVYDAEQVAIQDNGDGATCFVPKDAIAAYDAKITLADWKNGTSNSVLDCDQVVGPVNTSTPGAGFCTLSLLVTIPASGQAYVNVHLDYGFKGPFTDVNPVNTYADRYDKGSPDGISYDALVNNSTNDGPLAIDSCTPYMFSHDVEGCTTETCADTVYNVNLFKKIAGCFGLATNSSNGEVVAGLSAKLYDSANKLVKSSVTDKDGFYALEYAHKGKPALYKVCLSGGSFNKCQVVELRANGWSEVTFDVYTGTALVSVK